jgi:hypothetical protein
MKELEKVLIAGGDSFLYGLDMLDCSPANNYGPSSNTWPALLSNHMGREYVCASFPGSSNTAIARRTILACEKNKNKDRFVVIGWSFLNRFEFKFTQPFGISPDKTKDPEGHALDKRIGMSNAGSWLSFNILDLYGKGHMLKYLDSDMRKFLQDYYRYVGSDDIYEYYITLKEILYLQNYLELHKIPYLFTSAHSFFYKTVKDENVECLLNQIDLNKWFFYPDLKGFVQWAAENNYPKRDEHPSEEAHMDAFKLIKEHLDSKN